MTAATVREARTLNAATRTLAAHLLADHTGVLVVFGAWAVVNGAGRRHPAAIILGAVLVALSVLVATSHARHPDPYLPDTDDGTAQ